MKSEDLTLNHIKILKTVDEYGSFSKAAQKLGCSQALISKKVKQIEDYFKVRLLTRSPRAAYLTNKGKKLVYQTHSVIETIEQLQEEFQITLSAEGEDLLLGATPLIAEGWLKLHLHRFHLCFPGREIKEILVKHGKFFTDLQALSFDALLNSSPAYQEEHHCTRLQTYSMLLFSFSQNSHTSEENIVNVHDIDFANVVLLEELYCELAKNPIIRQAQLEQALIVDQYQDVLKIAAQSQKQTILPEFCRASIAENYQISTFLIEDIDEYGIYIHVPRFGELLVSAESLVRSFRLDQDAPECSCKRYLDLKSCSTDENNIVKIGIQRDSMGHLIASYGTQYISQVLRLSSPEQLNLKNIEIDRNFNLQIIPFASSEFMNKQMKRGELDICILDDTALLSNGSQFFNHSNFGSKLIAIASYNLLGQDISIVLSKNSSIHSISDLKGKRISTLFGSNAHRFILTLLDLQGIQADEDCTLINEDPRTAGTSLLNGEIDAHVCCNVFTSNLEEYASARQLSQDQLLKMKLPSLRGIVCRSQFMKENPKFVITYLHDLVVANYWFTSSSAEAINTLSGLVGINKHRISQFFNPTFGSRIDPTLKPQWSWLLKTLNRRLNGKYGISLFDVDFWIEDYFLRLVYNLLDLDYHFQQVSFLSELANSYFVEEKFNRYFNLML